MPCSFLDVMCSANDTNTRGYSWQAFNTPLQFANINNITFSGNTLATDSNCAISQANYAAPTYFVNVTNIGGNPNPPYTPMAALVSTRLPALGSRGTQD
jgi:hypothetical protein